MCVAANAGSGHSGSADRTCTTGVRPISFSTPRDSVARPTTSTASGHSSLGSSPEFSSSVPCRSTGPSAPAVGSATTGHPACHASSAVSPVVASPTTTSVRGPRCSVVDVAAVARVSALVHGTSKSRPSSGSGQSSSTSGTSGSRSGTLTCSGLPDRAVATARHTSDRHTAFCPGRRSATGKCSVSVAAAKIPCWSTVWLAPVRYSSTGRSAVTTSSGVPECRASSTAGCRFATAVPDVQTTAVTPPALASPKARNPALRSSIRTCSTSRPATAASCRANDSGALRDPGLSTTCRTSLRTSSSTSTLACAVDGFTRPFSPYAPAGRIPLRAVFGPIADLCPATRGAAPYCRLRG